MPTKQQIEESKIHRKNETAKCSKCSQVKSWSEFQPCKSRRPFGLASLCLECDRERKAKLNNRSYHADKEKSQLLNRTRNLKRNFNLSLDEYEKMLESQKGVCQICKQPENVIHHSTGKPQRLTIDHCHSSNKVRGLLCAKCNKGLGLFLDNTENLKQAIIYLNNTKEVDVNHGRK